jgi:hypothetical protein
VAGAPTANGETPSAQATAPKVSVEAVLEQDGFGQFIHFKVRSQESETVYLPRYRLPWRGESGLLVVAVDSKREVQLERYEAVDDPGPEADTDFVTLKLGESVTGKLYLGALYPPISCPPRGGEVVIFWSYRVWAAYRPLGDPVGGILVCKAHTSPTGQPAAKLRN